MRDIIHSGNISSQSVNYANYSGYSTSLYSDCTHIGANQLYSWYDWSNTGNLTSYFYGIWVGSPDQNIGYQLAHGHDDYNHLRIRVYDYGGWNPWHTLMNRDDTISWSNVTNKPGLINSGGMSSQYSSLSTWGTITAANGFGFGLGWDFPGGSDLEFGYKGGQISMQVDGLFYQDEGRYRVLDMNYYYVNSDRHLKKDVKSINKDHLEEMFNISDKLLKEFNWKDNGKHSYGFIAQEIQKYIPEAVDLDENHNILSVSYNIAYAKMLASIVNEVKKLKAEVRRLKQHN